MTQAFSIVRDISRSVVRNVPVSLGGLESFSPADLFASGEDGGWYDPSDLTSMFQGINGSGGNPSVGDQVGVVLDKSQMGGQTAGSYLAANDFGTDVWGQESADWTALSSVTVTGGVASVNYTGTVGAIGTDLNAVDSATGVAYYWTAVVSNFVSASDASIRIGGTGIASTALSITGAGTFSGVFITQQNSGTVAIVAATSQFDIAVTIRKIPGNHLVAPADIQRPILRDEIVDGTSVDVSGQPELVTNGTFDTDTSWAKNNFATISGGVANLTATNDAITQTLAGLSGSWFILSFDFDRSSGTNIRISAGGSILEEFAPIDDNPSSATRLFKAGASSNDFSLRSNTFVGTIDNVSIKLVPASAARRYYLDFDGVDDVLETPTYTGQANPSSLFTAFNPGTGTNFILHRSGDNTGFIFIADDFSGTTGVFALCGTPTTRLNGEDFSPSTRGVAHAATTNATNVIGFESLDLTNAVFSKIGVSNYAGIWLLEGKWYGTVLIDRDLTTAERYQLEYVLAQDSGVTYAAPVLDGVPTIG